MLRNRLRRIGRRRGAAAVEYGLLVGLVAVVLTVTLFVTGGRVAAVFDKASGDLRNGIGIGADSSASDGSASTGNGGNAPAHDRVYTTTGSLTVDPDSCAELILVNPNPADATLTGASWTPAPAIGLLQCIGNSGIAPCDPMTLTVPASSSCSYGMTNMSSGHLDSALSLSYSDGAALSIQVRGDPGEPPTPSFADYADTPFGLPVTSSCQDFRLQNIGDGTLRNLSIEIEDNGARFQLCPATHDACAATLAAGASCFIGVKTTPGAGSGPYGGIVVHSTSSNNHSQVHDAEELGE